MPDSLASQIVANLPATITAAAGAIWAWRASTKAAAANQTIKDVKQQTASQTTTINEIDRKADVAVAQSDGRLTKLQTKLDDMTNDLTASKTQVATLQQVIERLIGATPPVLPVVVTPPPVINAEGGRRQGDAPKKEPPP